MQPGASNDSQKFITRTRFWYALIVVACAIFVIRLFYLQVIKYDFYRKTALAGQFKEYEVPAERGRIKAHDGNNVVPIVLNEKKYTLFADPKYIKNQEDTAEQIQKIIGGNTQDYISKMSQDTRYAILQKKLSKEQAEQIDELEIKGIGTREEVYRTYPQGELAAQVLGFVNDEGSGSYGIEEYLNDRLQGEPGQLKAITDASGVPLVSNKDNIIEDAVAGDDIILTLDISMQKQLEEILKAGLERARSQSGSALIMDTNTGAIKAMANLPTYNPAEFYKVEDANVFINAAVGTPLEVGSTMKPLTAAAALNNGSVQKDSSYYDPSKFVVDNETISNIEEDGGPGTKNVADILQLSLNTGASWLLMQMGGGQINEQARKTWYDYMTNHYGFGKKTNIEQGYEGEGYIPSPVDGYGLNIQYANTAFGQGMTATPLQMGAALSSVINGGTYYRPRLVDAYINGQGEEQTVAPEIVRSDVVSPGVSQTMIELMEYTARKNRYTNMRPGYVIGGKTGTAQITRPEGGYYEDKYNGTFIGFVGGDKPQYTIVVLVREPKIPGYAGSQAAAPIFSNVVNMLIDSLAVTPKTT